MWGDLLLLRSVKLMILARKIRNSCRERYEIQKQHELWGEEEKSGSAYLNTGRT